MADLNVERISCRQNTSAAGQITDGGVFAASSNPMAEMVQNAQEQIISPEEILKRKKELQTLALQFINDIKTKNPIPDCTYATRDWGVTLREEAAKSRKNISEAQTVINELLTNLEKLPSQDYNKYFKTVFGIEPDEYRMETEQNPNFKIKVPSIATIRAVISDIANKKEHSGGEIRQTQSAVIQHRADENENVSQNLKEARDNQGWIKKSCSWFIENFTDVTSQKDVLEALGQDDKDIEELYNLAQKGDDVAFNRKYLQMTGVDFRIENFEKMEKAQRTYGLAYGAYERREIEDYINSMETNADNCNIPDEDRYSLDFNDIDSLGFEKQWPYSPLEQGLLRYFNNDKSACLEYLETFGLPQSASLKDKYEIVKEGFLTKLQDEASVFEDELGDIVSDKKLKTLRSEYEQSIKNAYGNNIAQDKLDRYLSNVERTYLISKVGVLLAAYSTGAGLIAEPFIVGGFMAAYEGTELATDSDGFTADDLNETLSTAASYALYDSVWGASKALADNFPKSEIINFFTSKGISPTISQKLAHMSIQAPTMYAGDHLVANLMDDDIDNMTELAVCLGFSAIDARFLSDNNFSYALWDLFDHTQPFVKNELWRRRLSQTAYLLIQDAQRQQQSIDDK